MSALMRIAEAIEMKIRLMLPMRQMSANGILRTSRKYHLLRQHHASARAARPFGGVTLLKARGGAYLRAPKQTY